jgi:phospholipid/cholesterol/gamma-HCH transport system substrate-binding protein
MSRISLEARVGLLVLVALTMLGAFVFVLGGVRIGDGYPLYIDFNNPGSVQAGAPVRIGGVKVGRVEEVRYMGGRLDPATGRHPLVRLRVSVDRDVQDTIHDDALFYVTSQGVLGEQFVAIDPGTSEHPVLAEGSIVQGVDPPRLDLALALGYELLEELVEGVRSHRDDLRGLMEDVVALVHVFRELLEGHRADVDHIVAQLSTAADEGVSLLRGARETYVEGPQPHRILSRVEHLVGTLDHEAGPLLSDARDVATSARDTLAAIGPEERTDIQETIHSAHRIASDVETATADVHGIVTDAQQIVRHVREGEGTIGALLMDEEIYDDLQEMIRDLKHNPWKFFWRE